MPPRAFGSEPRPVPSRPAPEPSPCNPLPGPMPVPIPPPPPLPPRPVFDLPLGDMASAPPPVEFGSPGCDPGWLERITPLPAAFPPALLGGATDDPKSSGPPAPVPLLPLPLPESALPPPRPGGGGTTSAEPRSVAELEPERCPELRPEPEEPPPMLAGGGTTCCERAPAPDLASDPPPEAEGGGGTGLVRKSPLAEPPQLSRSRLTSEGGGAITAGAGSVSLAVDDMSRAGAETGGATTSTV